MTSEKGGRGVQGEEGNREALLLSGSRVSKKVRGGGEWARGYWWSQ